MAPAMAGAEGTLLAAVCSRDESRAKEVAGRFGFSRAYGSYEEMLKDDRVQAVYICTPNALHAEQTIVAARAGKHVLVEKPMTLSVADAEAMVEACEAAGVRLGIGFHLRHHPAHRKAREVIRAGELGRTLLVETHWVVASGRREGWWQDPEMIGAYIMMARGVHLVDFIHYLSGRDVESVAMMTDARGEDRPLEETAIGTLRLGEDAFATLVATRHAGSAANGFTVYGTEGFMQAEGTIGPTATGRVKMVVGGTTTENSYQGRDPFRAEVESFNQSIQEGGVPDASGLDGLRSVRVTQALLESARTGRTVRL